MLTQCASCGAPIFWAATEKGKRMPIDERPRSDGNLVVTRAPDGASDLLQCRAAPEGTPSASRFVSHFATCPKADEHRKARR
jgi:hypothetical protein